MALGFRARVALPILLLGLGSAAFFQPSTREEALHGLWARPAGELGPDELRFYYFHPGGIGLYRYGRRHLNNTHSFDYRIEGRELVLRFRKTGVSHRVPFTVSGSGDAHWLELTRDPREPQATRYRRVMGPMQAQSALQPAGSPEHPFARMWTERFEYATGGRGFAIYQLQPPQDGPGLGWYHQGDWDDWSTEALRYEISGERLAFEFLERKERAETAFSEGKLGEGERPDTRTLLLEKDPRNYWQRRTLLDGGRTIFEAGSFGLDPILQLAP